MFLRFPFCLLFFPNILLWHLFAIIARLEGFMYPPPQLPQCRCFLGFQGEHFFNYFDFYLSFSEGFKHPLSPSWNFLGALVENTVIFYKCYLSLSLSPFLSFSFIPTSCLMVLQKLQGHRVWSRPSLPRWCFLGLLMENNVICQVFLLLPFFFFLAFQHLASTYICNNCKVRGF